MGRKKKQFIDRSKAQHFHVVHRSQQDVEKVHADDYATPSEFVLIPTLPLNEQRKLKKEGQSIAGAKPETMNASRKDHVDQFGMPNDGYDYSKHMKQMGGGTFISPEGKVVANNPFPEEQKADFDLPSDVLPGAEEERQFEAITISENVMDQDMYEALFGEHIDENFEEILDDFVVTASADPAEEEGLTEEVFDYDAHIARLIEKSRRQLGNFREDDEEEFPDDPGDFSDHGSEDAELRQIMGDLQLDKSLEPVKEPKTEERAMLDAQFEAALLEYGDSESDEEDYMFNEDEDGGPSKNGKIDMEGNQYFEGILDEFLEKQKYDHGLEDEETPIRSQTAKAPSRDAASLHNYEDSCGSSWSKVQERFKLKTTCQKKPSQSEIAESDRNRENSRDAILQLYDVEEENPLQDDSEDGPEAVEKLLEALPYLKRKEKEKWDCETIISTYTNLDNHPTVLSVPSGKKKPKNKYVNCTEENAHSNNNPSTIRLSKKSGIPLGVLPSHSSKTEDRSEENSRENKGISRNKKESKEEKRLRKAKIKEERKEKRKEKKNLKQQFKDEEREKSSTNMGSVATSVFKY